VERQVLVLGGERRVSGTWNEPERVVIRAITEKDHAELITVRFLESQDVSVELDGPLDVRDMEQDMADLAGANWCRHDFSFHHWLASLVFLYGGGSAGPRTGPRYSGRTPSASLPSIGTINEIAPMTAV